MNIVPGLASDGGIVAEWQNTRLVTLESRVRGVILLAVDDDRAVLSVWMMVHHVSDSSPEEKVKKLFFFIIDVSGKIFFLAG